MRDVFKEPWVDRKEYLYTSKSKGLPSLLCILRLQFVNLF